MNTHQIKSGYILDGTTVADLSKDKLYAFETHEYAKTFFDILVNYEQSKLDQNLLVSSTDFTGKWQMVPSNITSSKIVQSFNFDLGGEHYRLSLSDKPNMVQRLLLRLLGFKRI